MLEVKRGDARTGRSRQLLVGLTSLAVALTVAGVMMATGRWWAAAAALAVGAGAFAAPGIVLQWNWSRARTCTHCGARAARRESNPGDLDHQRRYIPAYTRTPVVLSCGECGHRSIVALARPYWGA
jgi:hypothetical protein